MYLDLAHYLLGLWIALFMCYAARFMPAAEERRFAETHSTQELCRRMQLAEIEPLVDRQPTPGWLDTADS